MKIRVKVTSADGSIQVKIRVKVTSPDGSVQVKIQIKVTSSDGSIQVKIRVKITSADGRIQVKIGITVVPPDTSCNCSIDCTAVPKIRLIMLCNTLKGRLNVASDRRVTVSLVVSCKAGVQLSSPAKCLLLSGTGITKLEFSSQPDGSATPFSPPIRQACRSSQGTHCATVSPIRHCS